MGTQIRTLVPVGVPQTALKSLSVTLPMWLISRWEMVGNRLGLVRSLKKVAGPLKLRQILALSNADMRQWIAEAGGRAYSKATLSHWEQAERYARRRKRLPRGYWRKRWMPHFMVEWFHKIIIALVVRISSGVYVARVRNVRVPWRVELWRTR